MKYTLAIGLCICLGACTPEVETTQNSTPAPPQYVPKAPGIEQLQDLSGFWMDSLSSDTSVFYEEWIQNEEGLLTGIGYVLSGQDTVFIEYLNLAFVNEEFLYQVKTGSTKEEQVSFLLMPSGADTLKFYNNVNEFPQEILYVKQDDGWKVRVSNDKGRELLFHLVPHEPNDGA